MKYIEYRRPDGWQLPKHIDLDDPFEKLYQLCTDQPSFKTFTYEDCGTFINLCCEAEVDVSDPDQPGVEMETQDVVCDVCAHGDMQQAWAVAITKAAQYFGIDIPSES